MSVVRDVGLVVLIGVAVFLAAMSVNTANEVSDLRRDNAALVAAVSVQDEALSELRAQVAAPPPDSQTVQRLDRHADLLVRITDWMVGTQRRIDCLMDPPIPFGASLATIAQASSFCR